MRYVGREEEPEEVGLFAIARDQFISSHRNKRIKLAMSARGSAAGPAVFRHTKARPSVIQADFRTSYQTIGAQFVVMSDEPVQTFCHSCRNSRKARRCT